MWFSDASGRRSADRSQSRHMEIVALLLRRVSNLRLRGVSTRPDRKMNGPSEQWVSEIDQPQCVDLAAAQRYGSETDLIYNCRFGCSNNIYKELEATKMHFNRYYLIIISVFAKLLKLISYNQFKNEKYYFRWFVLRSIRVSATTCGQPITLDQRVKY